MAGRKRKFGPREGSGNLQRKPAGERREDVIATVLEARQRVFRGTANQARLMPETSWLGLLRGEGIASELEQKHDLKAKLRGISASQYEAAKEYQRITEERRKLLMIPAFTEAGNLDRGGGRSGDEVSDGYIRRFRRIADLSQMCEAALLETWFEDVHARTVTKNVVLEGYYQPHRLNELRVGLNALARVLGT